MARIVIADDDEDIRDLILFKLQRMGHAVDPYPDGSSALEAVTSNPPDLVMLDVMMPGLSGIDVARAIRQVPELQRVPIMLLTARAQQSDIEAGFDAGADDYVTKPFSVNALGEHVTAMLELGSSRTSAAGEPQDEA